MTRVPMTVYGVPTDADFAPGNVGDCFRACLASVLGVTSDEVPHFADYPAEYEDWERRGGDPLVAEHGGLFYRRTRRWLRRLYQRDLAGYGPDMLGWWVDMFAETDDVWPRHLIGIVQSPRGDFKHSVVLDERGVIVWDPHPAGDAYGLDVIEFEAITAPYDPPPPTVVEERAAGVMGVPDDLET